MKTKEIVKKKLDNWRSPLDSDNIFSVYQTDFVLENIVPLVELATLKEVLKMYKDLGIAYSSYREWLEAKIKEAEK